MQSRFIRNAAFLVAALVAISLCLIDADAQTSKKRRSRRVVRPVITNPAITPPDDQKTTASGDKIISTADENPDAQADETTQTPETKPKSGKTTAKPSVDDQDTEQTINSLSNQVKRLNDKLGQMQETDQALMDMERLSRAEQRAETLRSQQVEVESKLADLQSRLEDAEYLMKPENIEREMATYGSTRPEVARDARRRKLEADRNRILAQMKILETSRVRLEGAVATADAEVDLLRSRLELRRAQESTSLEPAESRPAKNQRRPE
jgi:DNA repair exonuclease SbcCD ATPase subunit